MSDSIDTDRLTNKVITWFGVVIAVLIFVNIVAPLLMPDHDPLKKDVRIMPEWAAGPGNYSLE